MWSTWGASPWEGKSGVEVGIVKRKVARGERTGQTFPLGGAGVRKRLCHHARGGSHA